MTFLSAVADVRRSAEQLGRDRDRVARRVDELLDGGGWSGTAAAAYAEGWADWQRSAAVVLDGLAAMADLLEAAEADFTTTDVGSRAGLDRLIDRLG
ncbi:WXG100 family type VII secretion target [Nocardioides sp. SR21]|uniref:WXG100 family type VII secretion target n=1 Tax=Nocardioides sp. SR21 TaxID=2919501 RepID=UPI001FAA92D5|nr:WXG100 family type VII secretion target [Nocardioides sp. SR21]